MSNPLRHIPRARRAAVAAVVAAGALAAAAVPASAETVPAVPIDGPTNVVDFGDLDVAPDGTGAMVYVKKQGNVDRVYVTRLANGQWSTPERVDVGLNQASGEPRVAVANGGKTVIAYLNKPVNGTWTLRSAVSNGTGQPFTHEYIQGNQTVKSAEVEMNNAGIAYVAWTSDLEGLDLRASRYDGNNWTEVGEAWPGPGGILNRDPTKFAAESGTMRGVRVVVSDAGEAVMSWTEEGPGGNDLYDVVTRRVSGTAPNQLGTAVKADLPSLNGAADSGTADMADIDVAGNGRAWVVFRQLFEYGSAAIPRIIARPLDGNTLGAPQVLDGLPTPPPEGAEFPRIDVNSAGQGLLANPRQLTFDAWGSALNNGTWTSGFKVNGRSTDSSTGPVAAIGEQGDGLIAYGRRANMNAPRELWMRYRKDGVMAPDVRLSVPGYGSAELGQEAKADAAGNVVVGFLQRDGNDARIMAAIVDRPADPPVDPGNGGGGNGGGGNGGGAGGAGDTGTPPTGTAPGQTGDSPNTTPPAQSRFGANTLVDLAAGARRVRVSRKGAFALRLVNRNGFAVTGTAKVTVTKRVRRGRRVRRQTIVLGSKRIVLAARKTTTANLTLTKAGKAHLKGKRSAPVTVELRLTDPSGTSRKVTRPLTLAAAVVRRR